MYTVLSHTRLPLWAWIVIIGVGSVLIITVTLVIWRCWYVRQKATEGFRLENSQTPTRRVTVRRGRLVPTSHYLSLTGSKFGLNQFNGAEDAAEKERARSKSPFEWWNTILDRSQSRQSEMTQRGPAKMRNLYTPDIEAGPRREKAPSPPSSPDHTRQRDKSQGNPTTSPKIPRSTASRPTTQTNFSRSFVPTQHPASSSPSLRLPEDVYQQKQPMRSRSEGRLKSDMKSQSSKVSTVEVIDPESPSTPGSPPCFTLPPVQTHSFLYSPSASSSALTKSKTPSTTTLQQPSLSRQVSKPRSDSGLRNEYRTSRTQSLSSSHSRRPSYRSSSLFEQAQDHAELTRRESLSSSSKSRSKSLSRPETTFQQVSGPGRERSMYWETRPDLMPVRRPSKKGNVLRKKSLRRSEMVSWVGS